MTDKTYQGLAMTELGGCMCAHCIATNQRVTQIKDAEIAELQARITELQKMIESKQAELIGA